MKKLFILIGLLTTISIFSQNNELTKEQKEKLITIATPAKLQEWANNKLDVKKLDSIIKQRERLIDSLTIEYNAKIKLLRNEYEKTLLSIAKENKDAKTLINKENKQSDILVKKERLKYERIHLFIGYESFELNIEDHILFLDLNYKKNKIDFGIKVIYNKSSFNKDYLYSTYLKYKIF